MRPVSLAVLAALFLGGAAVAQNSKPADKPADKPAAPPAQPAQPSAAPPAAKQPSEAAAPTQPVELPIEAPDGTKMTVVQRSKVTLTIEIEDLKLGTGAECPPGANVMINYHGTLTDGKVFDSTRDKKPVTIPLTRVIPGWQYGVPGMKVGGIRRLTIPYQLAYGDKDINGQDGQVLIPAKSTLIFSVEMIAINGKDAEGNPYPPPEKVLSRVEKDTGLIIEELRLGDGAECPPGATVVCNYRGTLASDGSQFDSSYDRGQPAEFSLNQVIKGWQDGIPGMKVGGKRRLTVPAELAYGASGRPGIPPNSMLVFEVELVNIKN